MMLLFSARVSSLQFISTHFYICILLLLEFNFISTNYTGNSTYSDCEDGEIRLVGGSTVLEGRVEVCINNAWGGVFGALLMQVLPVINSDFSELVSVTNLCSQ